MVSGKGRKELDKVRRQGYALDSENWEIGVHWVAAPVFDFTSHPSHATSFSNRRKKMNSRERVMTALNLKKPDQRVWR